MPSKVTKDILRQFKLHFQNAEVRIPLALRQESPDIVFRSLIEDDAGPMENPGPMIGYEPTGGMGLMDEGMGLADQLVGAAMSQEGQGAAPAMPMPLPPTASPGGAQQPAPAPAQPQQGPPLPPDAEEILGML